MSAVVEFEMVESLMDRPIVRVPAKERPTLLPVIVTPVSVTAEAPASDTPIPLREELYEPLVILIVPVISPMRRLLSPAPLTVLPVRVTDEPLAKSLTVIPFPPRPTLLVLVIVVLLIVILVPA